MKKKIETLIKLLDDENPQTAQAAMAVKANGRSTVPQTLCFFSFTTD